MPFLNPEQWSRILKAQYAASMRVTGEHDDVQLTDSERVTFHDIADSIGDIR
ncbi:hypothetical protein [Curtobacterium sp. MCLR17_034]|uniref:hypothetical protein n=1 Tax=Curtobacterium sp. MCLR17_034 TaxID=2175623 RepID=UPI0015E8B36B|nr:hypothetical protein [Curtobacterium sp. MCLR17_034]